MKFIHISDIHLVSKEGPLNGSVPSERLEKCMNDIICGRHTKGTRVPNYGSKPKFELARASTQSCIELSVSYFV